MSDTTLWAELLAYGTGIGLSPIHIAVLLLLLLGPQPLRRGGWFVAGWVVTTLLTATLLVTVGHTLVLDMSHGSHHRTVLICWRRALWRSRQGAPAFLRRWSRTTGMDHQHRSLCGDAIAAAASPWRSR